MPPPIGLFILSFQNLVFNSFEAAMFELSVVISIRAEGNTVNIVFGFNDQCQKHSAHTGLLRREFHNSHFSRMRLWKNVKSNLTEVGCEIKR
jgi:hypothetical protein